MATQFQINVILDDETLKALDPSHEGDYLRAYKGVQSKVGGGASTVWLSTNDFSHKVSITWNEQYSGYIADSKDLKGGIKVDASNSRNMDLGDKMTAHSNGVVDVDKSGTAGDITVFNPDSKPWMCGMGEEVNGKMSPLCAFPLHGHHSVLMMPYEKVLLLFESGQTDTGTVVEEAISEGIIITLTGDETTREVSYNINNGWDAKGAEWAEAMPATAKLADKLIHRM